MRAYYHNHATGASAIEAYFGAEGLKLERIDTPDEDPRIAEPLAVVFVHTTADEEDFWIDAARKSPDTHFVFMSRSPAQLDLMRRHSLPNVHVCEFPADRLREYEQVKALFSSLARDQPDWSMLQRKDPSQWLLAAYALLLAKVAGCIKAPAELGELPPSLPVWLFASQGTDPNVSRIPRDWDQFWGLEDPKLRDAVEEIKECLSSSQLPA